jgi:hypothetical protein
MLPTSDIEKIGTVKFPHRRDAENAEFRGRGKEEKYKIPCFSAFPLRSLRLCGEFHF